MMAHAIHRKTPSEVWDDDFVLSKDNDSAHDKPKRSATTNITNMQRTTLEPLRPVEWDDTSRFSRTRQTLQDSRRMHDEINMRPPLPRDPSSSASATFPPPLSGWSEPSPVKGSARGLNAAEESWDDDFEDGTQSPSPTRGPSRRPTKLNASPSHRGARDEHENWDEDFEMGTSESPGTKRSRKDASWDSSDEEMDAELGFADREEDKTVTANSRRRALGTPPPLPPIPPLPLFEYGAPLPQPRSPTVSAFSIPVSGRDSAAYGSTAHLALRPTISAGSSSRLSKLPPSPPVHRERRRLRKKSRPPHLDSNILEFDGAEPLPSSPIAGPPLILADTSPTFRPATPSSRPSTPPVSSPMAVDLSSPPPSQPTRSPLLSRIGSVKRWGVRRKRASVTPAEVAQTASADTSLQEIENTARPVDPPSGSNNNNNARPGSSMGGRFFRSHGGGVGSEKASPAKSLKKEHSKDRLHLWTGKRNHATGSPEKVLGLLPPAEIPVRTAEEVTTMDVDDDKGKIPVPPSPSRSQPRRPMSMHVDAGPSRVLFPRHVSGPVAASSQDATITRRSVSAQHVPDESGEKAESSRGFMGNVRRISLVGGGKRHQRTKSNSGIFEPVERVPPVPALPRSSGEVPHSSKPSMESASSYFSFTENNISKTNVNDSTSHPRQTSDATIPSTKSVLLATPRSGTPSHLSTPKPPGSPQAASLGRATPGPTTPSVSINALRRSSLGDLKIPSRISKAQDGLKRDLYRVREFAAQVEQMKALRDAYDQLIKEIQDILDSPVPPSRPTSPLYHFRPRSRSNTHPPPPTVRQKQQQLATALSSLNERYQLFWECADLLVELGSGSTGEATPSASASVTALPSSAVPTPKGRERAITLAGDEGKPPFDAPVPDLKGPPQASPPPASWRASTGRHDLSTRQMYLLREMLHSEDPSRVGIHIEVPEETPTSSSPTPASVKQQHWQWGQGMDSTITLPSEETTSVTQDSTSPIPAKKRRSSRLRMTGFRDMLRSLKRNTSRNSQTSAVPETASAISSYDTHSAASHQQHQQQQQNPLGLPIDNSARNTGRRRAKTSAGPESVRSPSDTFLRSYISGLQQPHRSSPRRPSLASLFRIGQKSRQTSASGTNLPLDQQNAAANTSAGEVERNGSSGTASSQSQLGINEEEDYSDWDRMDSASDVDLASRALGPGQGKEKAMMLRRKKKPGLQPVAMHPTRRTPEPQVLQLSSPGRSFGSTRLKAVDEGTSSSAPTTKWLDHLLPSSPKRRNSRRGRPHTAGDPASSPSPPMPDLKVTMDVVAMSTSPSQKLVLTPENIKPLLENAKVVTSRLHVCVGEMKDLLQATA